MHNIRETHQHRTIPSEMLETQDLYSQRLQVMLDKYQRFAKWDDPYLSNGDSSPTPSWIEIQNYQLQKSQLWGNVHQEALALTATAFKESTDPQNQFRYTEYLLTLAHGANETTDPLVTNFKNQLDQHYLPWVSTAASLIVNLKNDGQTDKANFYSAILKPHLEVSKELAQQKETAKHTNISRLIPAYGFMGVKYLLN